jgi:hypothetical protein
MPRGGRCEWMTSLAKVRNLRKVGCHEQAPVLRRRISPAELETPALHPRSAVQVFFADGFAPLTTWFTLGLPKGSE